MKSIICTLAILLTTQAFAAPFDVRSYGAVGDGVHDDGPAFQAAFNAALVGGGSVYVSSGVFKITTRVVITNSLTPSAVVHFYGEGSNSRIVPNTPNDLATFNFHFFNDRGALEIDHLVFDGAPVGSLNVGGYMVELDRCITRIHDVYVYGMQATNGLFQNSGGVLDMTTVRMASSNRGGLGTTDAFVSNIPSIGGWQGFSAYDCWFGDVFDISPWLAGHLLYFGDPVFYTTKAFNQPFLAGDDAEVNAADSMQVEPQRYITDGITVEISRCRFSNAKFSTVKFDPTDGRYRRIWIHDSNFATQDSNALPNIEIKQADYVTVERMWSGNGGVSNQRPSISLVDAGHIILSHCHFTGDDLYRPPVNGAVYVTADAACKSLYVVDSYYKAIETQCPTMIKMGETVTRLRQAANVTAGSLVKLDPSNAGHVLTLGTNDSVGMRTGVALDSTSKATGYALFNASLSITEGDNFVLSDGMNNTQTITFSLSGAPGAVSVNNGMTADQRATALANFINALHGSSFKITAATVGGGSGRVNFTNDVEGTVGNVFTFWNSNTVSGSVSAVLGAIKVFAMGGGQSYVRIAEIGGQELSVKSDGSSAINPGDTLTLSANAAGHFTKASTNVIAVATSSAPATLDAVFTAIVR